MFFLQLFVFICLFTYICGNKNQMRKQGFYRKHNFPDADLYAMVVDRLKHAQRDKKEFENMG